MDDREDFFEKIADGELPPEEHFIPLATPLKSAAQLREDYKQDLMVSLKSDDFKNSIKRAISVIAESHFDILTPEEVAEMGESFAKVTDDKINNPSSEITETKPDEFISYQKLFGISDQTLTSIYKIAHDLAKKEKFDEAIDIFSFLMMLNPQIEDFTYGLGLCYQLKEDWSHALSYLNLACEANPNSVGAHVSSVECCKKLGDAQNVQIHLEAIEKIQKEEPQAVENWENVIESIKK